MDSYITSFDNSCINVLIKNKGDSMDKYKLTFGIEPTDKYEKAKQDLIQALRSVGELSNEERQVLLEELFGATQVAIAVDMFNKYLG